jgi:hypothetical protein
MIGKGQEKQLLHVRLLLKSSHVSPTAKDVDDAEFIIDDTYNHDAGDENIQNSKGRKDERSFLFEPFGARVSRVSFGRPCEDSMPIENRRLPKKEDGDPSQPRIQFKVNDLGLTIDGTMDAIGIFTGTCERIKTLGTATSRVASKAAEKLDELAPKHSHEDSEKITVILRPCAPEDLAITKNSKVLITHDKGILERFSDIRDATGPGDTGPINYAMAVNGVIGKRFQVQHEVQGVQNEYLALAALDQEQGDVKKCKLRYSDLCMRVQDRGIETGKIVIVTDDEAILKAALEAYGCREAKVGEKVCKSYRVAGKSGKSAGYDEILMLGEVSGEDGISHQQTWECPSCCVRLQVETAACRWTTNNKKSVSIYDKLRIQEGSMVCITKDEVTSEVGRLGKDTQFRTVMGISVCKDGYQELALDEPVDGLEEGVNDVRVINLQNQHIKNLVYILLRKAYQIREVGNDGASAVERDWGRNGETLIDFCNMREATACQLSVLEVASLRSYTSTSFAFINKPLREKTAGEKHPMAVTTSHIASGLKKLRKLNFEKNDQNATQYLWRGMRDRYVSDHFLIDGGSEAACMSTSENVDVVAKYAKSQIPLLFRIKISSPMDRGASLKWLSVYPHEHEVLYPPLTCLTPMFAQPIINSEGQVITLKVSFPS